LRLIIDTDAGVDDAQAIMLALTYPGVAIDAITTVTGNVHVDWVTRNVFAVLDVMRAAVPVYRGAEQPLLPGHWQPEAGIHGEDGLGNYRHRPAGNCQVEPEPAAVALVRLANEAPGELTLVALGPQTNIALACRMDPEFPRKIGQFVFMGGTISARGNTRNVTAEFNVFADPEAALIVLDAFPQSTMLSWETTLKHPFSWEAFDGLAAVQTRAGRFFAEISQPVVAFLQQLSPVSGYLLPDPLAMAVALEPEVVRRSAQQYVTVELQGALTRGQTVIDYSGRTGHPPNVTIVTELDIDRVHALFQRMLA
jgi:purine nucleosidase